MCKRNLREEKYVDNISNEARKEAAYPVPVRPVNENYVISQQLSMHDLPDFLLGLFVDALQVIGVDNGRSEWAVI